MLFARAFQRCKGLIILPSTEKVTTVGVPCATAATRVEGYETLTLETRAHSLKPLPAIGFDLLLYVRWWTHIRFTHGGSDARCYVTVFCFFAPGSLSNRLTISTAVGVQCHRLRRACASVACVRFSPGSLPLTRVGTTFESLLPRGSRRSAASLRGGVGFPRLRCTKHHPTHSTILC